MLLIDDVVERIYALKKDKPHVKNRLKLLCQSEGIQRTDVNNIVYFRYLVGKIIENKKMKEGDALYNYFCEAYNKIEKKVKIVGEIRKNEESIHNSIAEKLTRLEKHKVFKNLNKYYKEYPIVLTLNTSLPSVDNAHKQINIGLIHINSVEEFKSAVTETIIENFLMNKRNGGLDVDCTKFESARYFAVMDDLFRALIVKGLYQYEANSEYTESLDRFFIGNVGHLLEGYMANKMKRIADSKHNSYDVCRFVKMNEFGALAHNLLKCSIADYGDAFYKYIFIKEGRAALCMNYLNELNLVSQNSLMESLIKTGGVL